MTAEEAYKNIKLDVASYGHVTMRCFIWANRSGLDVHRFAKAVEIGSYHWSGKSYPRSTKLYNESNN